MSVTRVNVIENDLTSATFLKIIKQMALRVAKARAETGGQAWIHSGQVKASG